MKTIIYLIPLNSIAQNSRGWGHRKTVDGKIDGKLTRPQAGEYGGLGDYKGWNQRDDRLDDGRSNRGAAQ